MLKSKKFDSPIGPMIAIADDQALYLLEFVERKGLDPEIERLEQKTGLTITSGHTVPILSIENELKDYFKGKLIQFKTPMHLFGTPFQKCVWGELMNIPFGETRSYSDLATTLGKPTAYRAVALANSMNQLAIIVPCHRVISATGSLSGYAGGVERKKWLLDLEASVIKRRPLP